MYVNRNSILFEGNISFFSYNKIWAYYFRFILRVLKSHMLRHFVCIHWWSVLQCKQKPPPPPPRPSPGPLAPLPRSLEIRNRVHLLSATMARPENFFFFDILVAFKRGHWAHNRLGFCCYREMAVAYRWLTGGWTGFSVGRWREGARAATGDVDFVGAWVNGTARLVIARFSFTLVDRSSLVFSR